MSDEANSLSFNLDKCHAILSRAASNDLIPILQEMQEEYGYLPLTAMEEVSVRTDIPLSRIYGVVTFIRNFRWFPEENIPSGCAPALPAT
ncbi:MAG: NAD(P)H-dependent oxidoreductase subunit E [Planctomycetia bacterium]|nr:NAD(P)H-dependent oxidoreductase subunit E [Planctomycetia bacterium]